MIYEAQNFDRLLGTPGFSDQALNTHFTLYQGYVTNTNKCIELLKTHQPGSPEYAELKRRFGWEWSGMRLHEDYFWNLSKTPTQAPTDAALMGALQNQFGSIEAWSTDMKATGASRGIGWAMLTCDPLTGNLFNVWINEHDRGHLAGCIPLLTMDVFEHAFFLDYGTKKADYIDAFFAAIDWNIVINRYDRIPKTPKA